MKLLQTILKRLAYYPLLWVCITVWLLMGLVDFLVDLVRTARHRSQYSDLAGSWEDWVEAKLGSTIDYLGGWPR